MFNKDLIIPAMIGLGLYTQNNELNLCNNTTMLLALALLLQDHAEVEALRAEEECEHCRYCDRTHHYQPQCCHDREHEHCNCAPR